MGHINQYNNRQYFAHQLSGHETSEGIKQVGNAIYNSINTAIDVTQKANQSSLASNQIDLSSKFLAENNRINTKYQADPTNPERETELQEAFDSLASQYNINPLCAKQWSEIKTNVYDRYKAHNAQWVEQQQIKNAQVNLQDGKDKLLQQAFDLGMNDASVDDIRLIYANGHDALQTGAISQLGEVVTGQALSTMSHDFMTMYMTGLMQNNPAKALHLLNDEKSGIAQDINNADTLIKLKQSAQAKLLKKSEIDAVDRIADFITNNNELFNKVFDGTITTVEAQELLQNENLDRQTRNILSNMLGYSSRTDLYVNAETGEIMNKENKSTSSGDAVQDSAYSELIIDNKKWTFVSDKGKIRKPSSQEKSEITSELYLKGSQLLNGIDNLTPQDAIRKVAQFQSQIAQARYFGIDKGDYNTLMNDFVLPATQNIQNEARDYTDRAHWWGHHKYGYNQIEEYFEKNFDGKTEKNRKERDKEQALASVYYWSALNNYCSQNGMKMSDLKNLSGTEKASVFDKSAKQAIDLARSNSANPQLWFRSANPQYVSMIHSMLPNSMANDVITNVAVSAMSNPAMSEKDFSSLIDTEVKKQYAKMRTSNKSIVFGNNTKFDDIINQYSMLNGVDPLLIKSIIKQESGFKPNARSNAGAGGLMQLMPDTARSLGVKDLYDPQQNIAGGVKHFARLLKKYNYDTQLALAAYNAGEGNVAKYGNKIPPFKETQNYVKNIMATYNSIKG